MFFRLLAALISIQLLNALNTHDISGLNSDLWTMSVDKLPRDNWTFKLETYEGFPFEFDKTSASLCFESREDQSAILYFNREVASSAAASLSCCFLTSHEIRSSDVALVKVERVVLKPSQQARGKSSVHFDVQEPRGVFKDFFCSAIIDDSDSLSLRKTHLPSLGDISNLMNIGFRLNPDPINK